MVDTSRLTRVRYGKKRLAVPALRTLEKVENVLHADDASYSFKQLHVAHRMYKRPLSDTFEISTYVPRIQLWPCQRVTLDHGEGEKANVGIALCVEPQNQSQGSGLYASAMPRVLYQTPHQGAHNIPCMLLYGAD